MFIKIVKTKIPSETYKEILRKQNNTIKLDIKQI